MSSGWCRKKYAENHPGGALIRHLHRQSALKTALRTHIASYPGGRLCGGCAEAPSERPYFGPSQVLPSGETYRIWITIGSSVGIRRASSFCTRLERVLPIIFVRSIGPEEIACPIGGALRGLRRGPTRCTRPQHSRPARHTRREWPSAPRSVSGALPVFAPA